MHLTAIEINGNLQYMLLALQTAISAPHAANYEFCQYYFQNPHIEKPTHKYWFLSI